MAQSGRAHSAGRLYVNCVWPRKSAAGESLTVGYGMGDRDVSARSSLTSMGARPGVVRHGYGPARTIVTGIGPVEVARAKIRDRGAAGDGERIRFSSAILPLWARRTRSLDALLPVL